jgi:hypothetical protein
MKESHHTSEFHKWNAFVQKIPILKSILNANADAVTASWQTYGKNDKPMATMLDEFEGNGKESFKLIMNNALKIAKIGGDYYAEIVYDGDDNPINLVTLPPDNIRQVVKKGRIKKYEEVDGGSSWKPESIFHLAYNPIGCMTHGTSVIEPMNNLLIDLLQVWDDMAKIYHTYAKPFHLFKIDSDTTTEMQKIVDEVKKIKQVMDSDLFVPKGTVDVERHGIPQFSILNPNDWHRVIVDQIIMGSRVPELALGTGSVNSEESARMQFMGFRQMVRWDQKFLEENLRRQLFVQAFPEGTPNIRFSFAAEAQEDRFNRYMKAIQVVGVGVLPDRIKTLTTIKLLEEAGVIES